MSEKTYNMNVAVSITKNDGNSSLDYYDFEQTYYNLPYSHVVLLEKLLIDTIVKTSEFGQKKAIAEGADPVLFKT